MAGLSQAALAEDACVTNCFHPTVTTTRPLILGQVPRRIAELHWKEPVGPLCVRDLTFEASLNRSRVCDQRFLLSGASSLSKNSAASSATCLCTSSRSTPGLSTNNFGSCFFPASVPTSRNV